MLKLVKWVNKKVRKFFCIWALALQFNSNSSMEVTFYLHPWKLIQCLSSDSFLSFMIFIPLLTVQVKILEFPITHDVVRTVRDKAILHIHPWDWLDNIFLLSQLTSQAKKWVRPYKGWKNWSSLRSVWNSHGRNITRF